jgi:hypothetical protein
MEHLNRLTNADLRNLAKEYNLTYIIGNIERSKKPELVKALYDHLSVEFKNDSNIVVKNKVDYTKQIGKVVPKHDEKVYTAPEAVKPQRIRKNMAELKPLSASDKKDLEEFVELMYAENKTKRNAEKLQRFYRSKIKGR